ncbi:MAG TPA: hypothetical protein VLM05_13310 [Mycobacteriales bacterium]|nr:hypothetical protein [Mycobacteriales bacterium]
MEHHVTDEEARAALDAVAHGRRRVIDEIDLPRWYWWGMAGGWVLLGVLSDVGNPWVTTVATVAFGAAHASIAPRVVTGRHRTGNLSVSAEVAGRQVPRLVIGGLLAMVLVTIAAALVLNADGARHPSVIASVFAAVIILFGGPQLLAGVRRRAARSA